MRFFFGILSGVISRWFIDPLFNNLGTYISVNVFNYADVVPSHNIIKIIFIIAESFISGTIAGSIAKERWASVGLITALMPLIFVFCILIVEFSIGNGRAMTHALHMGMNILRPSHWIMLWLPVIPTVFGSFIGVKLGPTGDGSSCSAVKGKTKRGIEQKRIRYIWLFLVPFLLIVTDVFFRLVSAEMVLISMVIAFPLFEIFRMIGKNLDIAYSYQKERLFIIKSDAYRYLTPRSAIKVIFRRLFLFNLFYVVLISVHYTSLVMKNHFLMEVSSFLGLLLLFYIMVDAVMNKLRPTI